MYFKKLEIFGFKSFADKTVLNFEPGITAIVGPNGCGKSNVFDSIRWVLGEQSMKELRGSSKEDVIFNGTEKKPSLGFAEVSLTFSNESRMLPIEYDEVTITRRVFRSGESEYLLNKTNVRLKDINEMLMGTGIGAEAYSLVQQGKVDLVVSAKPEDRRIILDEASGITKYKTKKKEALNKLKDADNNLLRVTDITTEVKRQIGSIERQANKARKYKVEYEKLKDIEVKMAQYELGTFSGRKFAIQELVESHKEKDIQLTKELEELNQLLENETQFIAEIEQKINEVHAEEIKLEGQIDLNNRQISFNEERIASMNENEKKSVDQKEQLIVRCKTQQDKLETLKQEVAVLKEEVEADKSRLEQSKQEQSDIERIIRESKEKIKDHEEKILGLTSKQVHIRNRLTDIMKEIQGGLARKRRLEFENDKVSNEKQEIDMKSKNMDYQINSLQGSICELKITKSHHDHVLNELKLWLESIEEEIDDQEKQKLFLKSQKEFIEKMHAQYKDIPDPIIEGRLITQTPPLDHHTGIIGKVKEVAPIGHQRLNQLGMDSSDFNPVQLYEIVCETKFIELDPQQITLKIEEISREIESLEGRQAELQEHLNKQNESCEYFLHEIQTKEKAYSILEAQKKDIIEEAQKLKGEIDLVDSELDEVNETLASFKKQEEELNYEIDTVNQELSWCQNDIRKQQDGIAENAATRESIAITTAQLETEIQAKNDKYANLEDNQKIFTETLDGWLEEINKIDEEVSSFQAKRQQFKDEIDEWIDAIDELKRNKESIESVLSEYQTQKEDVSIRIGGVRTNIDAIEEEIIKIKKELHDSQMKEQELEFSERGIKDRLLQAYKLDLDNLPVKEEASSDESQGDEPQQEETAQGQDEDEQLKSALAGLKAQDKKQTKRVEEEIVVTAENIDEIKFQLEKLRKKCDSFGSVNLVAIEEYEELKERFEFLTKQQSDLLEAKSQLMSTINKINRATRQKFMDTFTRVSEEFRIYYRMLFGGGEAQLVLLDPENVLESGIDIVARPPGKKLQSISLLSGGEKTLTAIALIFGVFKVNPSPFCVLDEIDAALDEANVGRFSYLLKEFANIAQFIIITHNKKTMSHADVMYGVTMPETGCSRLVSVDFSEKNEKETDAVPAGV